jgi:hypothetical protein
MHRKLNSKLQGKREREREIESERERGVVKAKKIV